MPYILGMLKDEHRRLLEQKKDYLDILQDLPRIGGSITKKIIYHNEYYYFTYREGKKIKTEYIKKQDLEEFMLKLKERDRIKQIVKDIDVDLKIIEKTLKREKVLK